MSAARPHVGRFLCYQLLDVGLVTKANHRSSSPFYKGSTLQGCHPDVIALYPNGDMNPPILAMMGTSTESVVTVSVQYPHNVSIHINGCLVSVPLFVRRSLPR